MKAKNENSLSACASERAYAREGWRKGKRVVGRGEKKSCGVFSECGRICRESTPFFSLVERNLIFSSEDEEVCAEMPYY